MTKDEAISELKRKKKPLTQEAFVNATRNGVPHLVREYIAAGFDVNAPDKKSETALGAAVSNSDAPMVRLLQESGAQADSADYFFDAVYNAPFDDDIEIISLLVAAGCPVHFVEETTGLNALGLAREMGNAKVIAKLEEVFANDGA